MKQRRNAITAGVVLYAWSVAIIIIPSTLQFAPLGAAGTPAQIIGLAAAAWWFSVQLGRQRVNGGISQPTHLAMGTFVLAMIISYVAAMRRPVEGLEISSADRGLILVVSWAGLLLLTSDGIVSRKSLDDLMRFLVNCMGIVGVLGVIQYLTHTSYVDQIQIPGLVNGQTLSSVYDRNGLARTAGTATHPIEFGVALTMMLPIALHYAFTDRDRSIFWRWAPVVAICAALPLTMSRSAFLGIAVVLAILMPSWPSGRRLGALLGVFIGLVVVYVALPGVLGTMFRLFTGISEDGSARSRTDSYGLAFEFIREQPVFGRGISTFLPSYRILDNQYLGLLIEAGVVGLAAFVTLLTVACFVAYKLSRSLRNEDDRSLARSLMAAIACAGVSCATFDAFGFPQVAGLLFFFIGVVGALNRLAPRSALQLGSVDLECLLDQHVNSLNEQ